jgi:putative Mg2+ transporter-C (MgtC) family protein
METAIDVMSTWEVMKYFGVRSSVSIIAGLIIGIERTKTNHAAGIKTIVFVCLGSCLFSSLSFYLHEAYPQSDPTRILGQIITGIGFLCGGVIFMSRDQKTISGLTSSAMIWSSCALGVMAGAGLYVVPLLASITMVAIIVFLRWVEKFFDPPM